MISQYYAGAGMLAANLHILQITKALREGRRLERPCFSLLVEKIILYNAYFIIQNEMLALFYHCMHQYNFW